MARIVAEWQENAHHPVRFPLAIAFIKEMTQSRDCRGRGQHKSAQGAQGEVFQ
jgi:hypothetical protein